MQYTDPLDDTGVPGGGIVICLDEGDYLFLGHGYRVEEFRAQSGGYCDILDVDEILVEPGQGRRRGRRLNGDELGIQLPQFPAVRRVRLFSYQ